MFVVPKSLLKQWSDYQAAALDREAFLEAYLEGVPDIRRCEVDLAQVAESGVSSDLTERLVASAVEELKKAIVSNGRYFHNVETIQTIGYDESKITCTPFWSPPRAQRFLSSLHRPRESDVVVRIHDGLPRRFLRWVHHSLNPGDCVVVDAPLHFDGEWAHLCDFPPYLSLREVRIQLDVSPTMRSQLSTFCRDGGHPLCRTLGIYGEQNGQSSIKALQFSIRVPKVDDPEWVHELFDEAKLFSNESAIQLKGERGQLLGRLNELLLSQADGGPGSESEVALRERLQMSEAMLMERLRWEEKEIYDGAGFWVGLAMMLPWFGGELSLTVQDIDFLLHMFDHSYDEKWKSATARLHLTGEIRYTPAAVGQIRKRIQQARPKADPTEHDAGPE